MRREGSRHLAAARGGVSPASCCGELTATAAALAPFPRGPVAPAVQRESASPRVPSEAASSSSSSSSSLRCRFHSLAKDGRRTPGVKVFTAEARSTKSLSGAADLMHSARGGCHLQQNIVFFLFFLCNKKLCYNWSSVQKKTQTWKKVYGYHTHQA